jgi:chromosome segregation ATPase
MKDFIMGYVTGLINTHQLVIEQCKDTHSYIELTVAHSGFAYELEGLLDIIEDTQEDKDNDLLRKRIRELEDENENLKGEIKDFKIGIEHFNIQTKNLYEENTNRNNEILKLKKDIVAEKAERDRQVVYCKSWQKNCIQLREKLERYEGKQ